MECDSTEPFADVRPKWIVAAGGYRSGSTLQYNLVGTYLELAGLGSRIGLVDPDDVDDMIANDQPGLLIAKTHHIVAGFNNFARPTAWAPLLECGLARAVMSERDEAGVRRSMCRKFGIEVGDLDTSQAWRENLANTARWRQLGAFVQSYDDLTDRPVEALRAFVRYFGLDWFEIAAETAALETDRAAVRAAMTSIPDGQYDNLTLVHFDHIEPDGP